MKTDCAALSTALLLIVSAGMMQADNGGRGNGQNNNNNQNQVQTRLRTDLTGASIMHQKPEGNAQFRNDGSRMRFQVEVENVNLPDGTILTVALVDKGVTTTVGMITIIGGEGELELDSQHGDMVPTAVSGDMVMVSNGAAAVLAGAF